MTDPSAVSSALAARWHTNLPIEVAYWNVWMDSHGRQWAEDPDAAEREFDERFDPEMSLQQNLRALIDAIPGTVVRILDVGAGPATSVGKVWPGRSVAITAIDPLADVYRQLLRAHGLTPPVITRTGTGETINALFASTFRFDLAHARNALDHAWDPVVSITNMVQAVAPGTGVVYLLHHEREGERRKYGGLHQWNFVAHREEFLVEAPGIPAVNITQELASEVVTSRVRQIDGDIEVVFRRRPHPTPHFVPIEQLGQVVTRIRELEAEVDRLEAARDRALGRRSP